jgi:hypothetical protein
MYRVPFADEVGGISSRSHVFGHAGHVDWDPLVAPDGIVWIMNFGNDVLHIDINRRPADLKCTSRWRANLVDICTRSVHGLSTDERRDARVGTRTEAFQAKRLVRNDGVYAWSAGICIVCSAVVAQLCPA